ncbi:MAG: inositol monophosphatase [Peptococcaceae bacterium]|nr:inositol monophosphatase [Peptococcaceae bacterium]
MPDINAILEDVKMWVQEVGALQKKNFRRKSLLIETKSSEVDLVTEIDKISEEFFIEAISKKYPGHSILSEESGENEYRGSDFRWIIDPLDGTTNYAQGLPIYAISVALQYKGETELGVIYLPMLDLLFEAVRGQKAYLNGEKIEVGTKTRMKECLLATGFPYDQAQTTDNNTNYFSYFVPRARAIRRLGSAAYDLANVAAGIVDGYWELNLSLWDVAAGILLVQEAGGKVILLNQKRGVSLIAGNNTIAEKILRGLEDVDQQNRETGK